MKIRLEYACISNALDETSSSLLTYSHFKKLEDNKKGSGYDKLNEVIIINFKNLGNILKYNIINDIHFYSSPNKSNNNYIQNKINYNNQFRNNNNMYKSTLSVIGINPVRKLFLRVSNIH